MTDSVFDCKWVFDWPADSLKNWPSNCGIKVTNRTAVLLSTVIDWLSLIRTDCRTACNRASVLNPIQACNRSSCSRTSHVQACTFTGSCVKTQLSCPLLGVEPVIPTTDHPETEQISGTAYGWSHGHVENSSGNFRKLAQFVGLLFLVRKVPCSSLGTDVASNIEQALLPDLFHSWTLCSLTN
jgi:hypothetical protein